MRIVNILIPSFKGKRKDPKGLHNCLQISVDLRDDQMSEFSARMELLGCYVLNESEALPRRSHQNWWDETCSVNVKTAPVPSRPDTSKD